MDMIRYKVFVVSLLSLVLLGELAFASGKQRERAEFVSFDIREQAQGNLREQSQYYLPLEVMHAAKDGVDYFITQVEVPVMWLDRDVFVHFDGLPSYTVFVNDKKVGEGTDSYSGTEFLISPFITDGLNTVRVEYVGGGDIEQFEFKGKGASYELADAYIYSQPKLSIADYEVQTLLDTIDYTLSVLDLKVVLANSYNSPETISVGYDIYSPEGKLVYYNLHDISLEGNSTDTLAFMDKITDAHKNLWSAENPKLYETTIYVRLKGRMTEYVTFKVGFTDLVSDSEGLVLNGDRLDLKAVNYNSAQTEEETSAQLRTIKSQNFNTICPDYPQPYWFYDLCDKLGFYVIDQANLNCERGRDDRRVGGTPTNNPEYLDLYLARTKALYDRNKNRACVIAWSLGGYTGNGFNMYRSYQGLKVLEGRRAVICKDAQSEWNSDMDYPSVQGSAALLLNAR